MEFWNSTSCIVPREHDAGWELKSPEIYLTQPGILSWELQFSYCLRPGRDDSKVWCRFLNVLSLVVVWAHTFTAQHLKFSIITFRKEFFVISHSLLVIFTTSFSVFGFTHLSPFASFTLATHSTITGYRMRHNRAGVLGLQKGTPPALHTQPARRPCRDLPPKCAVTPHWVTTHSLRMPALLCILGCDIILSFFSLLRVVFYQSCIVLVIASERLSWWQEGGSAVWPSSPNGKAQSIGWWVPGFKEQKDQSI